jgi:hypothetical protein
MVPDLHLPAISFHHLARHCVLQPRHAALLHHSTLGGLPVGRGIVLVLALHSSDPAGWSGADARAARLDQRSGTFWPM